MILLTFLQYPNNIQTLSVPCGVLLVNAHGHGKITVNLWLHNVNPLLVALQCPARPLALNKITHHGTLIQNWVFQASLTNRGTWTYLWLTELLNLRSFNLFCLTFDLTKCHYSHVESTIVISAWSPVSNICKITFHVVKLTPVYT